MMALLRPFKRVANDPPAPRRAALVVLRANRERLFWMAAGGVVCLLVAFIGTAFWVMHDVQPLLDAPAPVAAAAPAATEPRNPKGGPVQDNASAGILLPADSLTQTAGHKDNSADPAVIAFVAAKMGQKPLTGEDNGAMDSAQAARIVIDDDAPSLAAAASDAETANASTTPSAKTEAAQARLALAQGDVEAAIAGFDRAVRLEPGNIAYRLGLGIAYDHNGQSAAALGLYRQVLTLAADQDEPSRLGLSLGAIRARMLYLESGVVP